MTNAMIPANNNKNALPNNDKVVNECNRQIPKSMLDIINSIIESISDGIFIVDMKGYYITANKAFEKMTNINRRELTGQHTNYLIEKKWLQKVVNLYVLEDLNSRSKIIQYPSGKDIMVTSDIIYNVDGVPIGAVSNLKDVSKLNQLHEQLKQSKMLINQYKRNIDELEDKINIDNKYYIAQSTECRKIFSYAKKVARSDVTVLITGESGTGKEIVARYIHKKSDRQVSGEFVKIDCASLPPSLLETELFGYEKGAFTNAKNEGKIGLLELANHGTVFLDEIGELPLNLQPKLLTVLQDRTARRVGGTKNIPTDIRIIAATNVDLMKMISEHKFRSDLYYRLNVVPIHIKPLRERKSDIIPLIKHFLLTFNEEYHVNKKISSNLMNYLANNQWIGNTRELRNTIERLVVTSETDIITIDDLDLLISDDYYESMIHETIINNETICHDYSLRQLTNMYEKKIIQQVLERKGNLVDAAKELRINVSTLVRKNRKHCLTGYTRYKSKDFPNQ